MDEVKRYIVARSQAIEEGTVSTPCMAHEGVMVLAADHDRRCADLAADIATLGDGLQHAISIADGAEREAEALRAEVERLRHQVEAVAVRCTHNGGYLCSADLIELRELLKK